MGELSQMLLDDSSFARAVLDAAPVIVLVLDRDGRVCHCNGFLERLIGLTVDELRGRDWVAQFVLPEDQAGVRERFTNAVAGAQTHGRVTAMRRPGAEPLLIEWHTRTVVHGGQPAVVAVGVDITARKQAALEREELGRLFALFNAAVDEVFMLISPDRERVLFLSESAERVFGVDRQAVYRDLSILYEVIHPDDRPTIRAAQRRPLPPGGRAWSHEFRVVGGDHGWRWIVARMQVSGPDSALPGAVVAITMDITARREAEAQVRRLNEELERRVDERTSGLVAEQARLLRVLDGMRMFVAILDPEGRIVHVNRYARERLAARSDAAPGRSGQIFPGLAFSPRSYREARAKFAQMQAQGWLAVRFDLELRLASGEDRVLDVTVNPIFDHDGGVTELVAAGVDVSDARHNEQRLRESLAALALEESRLADAQRIAEVGDWDWDVVADRLYWSDQIYRIVGRSCEEIPEPRYEDFLALVHPGDRGPLDAAVRRALDASESYRVEHRMIRPNGEVRYVLEQAEITRDRQGRPLRMQGTAQDITRLKQVESQLRTSLAEKEALLNEVHHRVKNNLQVVVSLLYLQGLELDEQMQAVLEECRFRLRSMALIHEQLYLSGQISRIDVLSFLSRLAAELARAFTLAPTPTIRVTGTGSSIDIERAVPLALIANELLTNALKYAYPSGWADPSPEIRVKVSETELVVEDDGVGFAAADEAAHSGGSLGLRLVRTLAMQLQAELHFESGGGTRVRLRMPG